MIKNVLKGIYYFFFTKEYGHCGLFRSHDWGEWKKNEGFTGTGKFLNDVEIKEKYLHLERRCSNCGEWDVQQ